MLQLDGSSSEREFSVWSKHIRLRGVSYLGTMWQQAVSPGIGTIWLESSNNSYTFRSICFVMQAHIVSAQVT